jgi:hypothetical protein
VARTTIDIDDGVLRELKARRQTEGKPLGVLVSELLALALRSTKRSVPDFEWTSAEMGRARIDLDDREAVWAVLDRD